MFEDLYLLYQAIFLNYDVHLGHLFLMRSTGLLDNYMRERAIVTRLIIREKMPIMVVSTFHGLERMTQTNVVV
ncbi:hypothetical protein T230_09435 [Tannerella sp. oral taxon BU063 isolate Cell 1/3]|uniref:Uncharacterized protein n=1 Tax=Tannerella sp. oral taxon BU063 isolate Cell 1/3 TaxID=1411022 RepID=W2CKM6_9BACT|nr:hypothetical protein T230_09435 [Tannerella sp. oral taxon BU063 isolate Cell 1/3]